MKKPLLVLSFLLIFTILSAQDFIYLRDGSRVAANVKSIDNKSVLYKDVNDPTGSTFSINKSQVMLIAYENGNLKFFKRKQTVIQRYSFKKNFLTYHLADLIINNFTLSYEHLFKNGSIGLQIPVSFGYGNYEENDGLKNNFYSGIYLNLYPTGQGKWRYFLGPAVRLGIADFENKWYNYPSGQLIDNSKHNFFYGKLFINNGVMFTPVSSLSIRCVLSLGIRYTPNITFISNNIETAAAFSFNMSYRF